MQDASGAHGASIGDLAAAADFTPISLGRLLGRRTSCGDSLVASHFWSLALEMQFYALAPLLVLLPPRALALGGWRSWRSARRRPARGPVLVGGPARRLIVGVMLASQVAQRAAWLAKLPASPWRSPLIG